MINQLFALVLQILQQAMVLTEVDGASATFQYAHSGTKWVANKDLQQRHLSKMVEHHLSS